MGFLGGHGTVLDAFRNDEYLAGAECDDSVSELDLDSTAEYQEEVIGVVMFVPDELAFDLDDHKIVAVEFADDS